MISISIIIAIMNSLFKIKKKLVWKLKKNAIWLSAHDSFIFSPEKLERTTYSKLVTKYAGLKEFEKTR